jgi:bifunctional DNA-binding transcriptional regulator/antitoxin component of YhaV-PrlF toxin-antitoxin module
MASAFKPYRKLHWIGAANYSILIPPTIIERLGWREHQKLTVTKKGKGVLIEEWKPRK